MASLQITRQKEPKTARAQPGRQSWEAAPVLVPTGFPRSHAHRRVRLRGRTVDTRPTPPDLGGGGSRLQQNLVVQWFPERVIRHGHRELRDARGQLPCHPLLELLLPAKPVLQLARVREGL